jgi:transposase-like protein
LNYGEPSPHFEDCRAKYRPGSEIGLHCEAKAKRLNRFLLEFKVEAVRLSYETDKPLDELATDLGISRSSMNRWRREYVEDPDEAFPGKGQQKERDAEIAQL